MSDPISRYGRLAWIRSTALAVLLFTSAYGAIAEKGGSIQGEVRRIDGAPLPPDVTARLEEAEGVVIAEHQHFVGTNGKFEFRDLNGDTYRIVVTAKGFQTVTVDVDMNYLASRFPSVYLVPVREKKSPTPESAETTTDLAAPKKARKEYEKGAAALQEGKLDEARRHLQKAVEEDDCYARAQTGLGLTLAMQHELTPAEAAFRKSIQCDGAFLEPYIQLAILLNAQQRYKDSETVLMDGLRRSPAEWQIYYQLGLAHDNLGDYEQAQAEYLKAQTLHPAVPPEFHLRLADVYLNRKEYSKAYTELQTYLASNPNGSIADRTRNIVRQIETSGVLSSNEKRPDPGKP